MLPTTMSFDLWENNVEDSMVVVAVAAAPIVVAFVAATAAVLLAGVAVAVDVVLESHLLSMLIAFAVQKEGEKSDEEINFSIYFEKTTSILFLLF